MKGRFSIALALAALVIAVLGSTSVGQAASHAVKAGVNKARSSTLAGPLRTQAPSVLRGPRGPRGLRGRRGPRGLTGPAGQAGPAGPAGATGATGATGPQGIQGPQGPVNPNADRVNGRRVQCPAGTVEYVSLCFETTNRSPDTVFIASDTCRAAGGFLADGAILRSGRGGNPLTLAAGGEWTSTIYNNNGTFQAMTIANAGGFAAVGTLTPTPYRCAYSPVRAVGASAPEAPTAHLATHADGS